MSIDADWHLRHKSAVLTVQLTTKDATLFNCVNLLYVFRFSLNSLPKPVITQLIAGHTLTVSLCTIYTERHFASLPSFKFQKTCRSLCHTNSATAKWGNSEHVLSVCRALSVTGHQSSAHRLLQLPLLYQSVKTLAVHCHCDVCGAAGGHSAGCGRSWVCLRNKIS